MSDETANPDQKTTDLEIAQKELLEISGLLKYLKGNTAIEKVRVLHSELGTARSRAADWEDRKRNLERIEHYVLEIAADLNGVQVPNNDDRTASRAKLELPDRVRWVLRRMKEVEADARERIEKAESRPPKDAEANAGMAYTYLHDALKDYESTGKVNPGILLGVMGKAADALCQTRYSKYFDELASAKIDAANMAERVATLAAKLREVEEERNTLTAELRAHNGGDGDDDEEGEGVDLREGVATGDPADEHGDDGDGEGELGEYRAAVRVLSRELVRALTPSDGVEQDPVEG
jgi:hypothetical protein